LPFDFHFLRPLWLTALIPVAIVVLLVIRRQRPEAQWGDLIAPKSFRKVEGPAGRFALGNAEAQNHAYEKAIKAYDEVLAAEPNNAAAKHNKAIVEAALEVQEEKRRKQEKGEAPPDEKADEMRVDPKQKGGKRIQVQADDLTTPGAAEAWMRQVQTSPADFLKLKFAIQAATPGQPAGPPR
jgi:Ca-activated chloride channel homolog